MKLNIYIIYNLRTIILKIIYVIKLSVLIRGEQTILIENWI